MTGPVDLAGRGVAPLFAAIARARRGKSLHPRGTVLEGRLERTGARPPTGVPWLDEPGTDDVVARISRGSGLPAGLPDLLGLAVRVPGPGGRPVDLLFSSSGTGRVTRWVPTVRRDAAGGFGSLMTFRRAERPRSGRLVLGALPEARPAPSDPGALARRVEERDLRFALAVATPFGPWRRFARLVLTGADRPLDPDVRFDGIRRPAPGLVADGAMAHFREPSYAASQAVRGGDDRPAGAPPGTTTGIS